MKKLFLLILLISTSLFAQYQPNTGTSSGACTFGTNGNINCAATGTNQNITLTPSGTGTTVLPSLGTATAGTHTFNSVPLELDSSVWVAK